MAFRLINLGTDLFLLFSIFFISGLFAADFCLKALYCGARIVDCAVPVLEFRCETFGFFVFPLAFAMVVLLGFFGSNPGSIFVDQGFLLGDGGL